MRNRSEQNNAIAIDNVAPLVNTNDKKYRRFGWAMVLLGFGGFVLWAMAAPLDEGVPVTGTVMVSGNRKAIQHPTGGIIDSILVHEGSVVKAGQVLVRLNATQVSAQADQTRAQYYMDRATEARLIAERDGRPSVPFPDALKSVKNDPQVISDVNLQKQLFISRQSELHSGLAAIDDNVAGLQVQLQGLKDSLQSKKEQLKLLTEQLSGVRDLSNEGYVPRNRALELERTEAELSGSISEDMGNMGRAQHQIAQLRMQRLQTQDTYQKEVRTQLADVQREATELQSRLVAQKFDLANVDVRAPVDGTVVGLNVFTKGGVVAPGATMMSIVPSDDPLILEGQLPVDLVDKVHPGLKAELTFPAFNRNTTPEIPGIVTMVSADRLTDEHTGQPYYRVQAKVAPEGMKKIANLQIKAGMPVVIFIKTGERTMMNYLLKPVFDRARTSFTED